MWIYGDVTTRFSVFCFMWQPPSSSSYSIVAFLCLYGDHGGTHSSFRRFFTLNQHHLGILTFLKIGTTWVSFYSSIVKFHLCFLYSPFTEAFWFSLFPFYIFISAIYVLLLFGALKGWIWLGLYSVATWFLWRANFVIDSLKRMHELWGSLFHNVAWVLF